MSAKINSASISIDYYLLKTCQFFGNKKERISPLFIVY